MYFPIGWPKTVNLNLPTENDTINHICCDAVKILVAAVSDYSLGIWYANPLIPIAFYRRTVESVSNYGTNRLIIWKPDSRHLSILTNSGVLLVYQIDFEAEGSGILTLIDSPMANLRRDSAELFIKENIPQISLRELCIIQLDAVITAVCCISLTELLIATDECKLIRATWAQIEAGECNICDNSINLREIPFYVTLNSHLKNLPPIGINSYIATMEYSPFIGGCAAVFSDTRAAYLIAMHLRFETQNMHGFWVPEIEDATICSINHKFRLLAYGRQNSDVAVYAIEDATGGLEFSHRLSLNSSVIPGTLGPVNELKWSPDGCVLVVSWENGGISLWSTFGALLMSTLSWDFGLHVDLAHYNPLKVKKMEWSTEGYQLYVTTQESSKPKHLDYSNVLQFTFVKSALAMNPCMSSYSYILLQGDDTLYLNQGDNLEKIYFGSTCIFPNNIPDSPQNNSCQEDSMEITKIGGISTVLSESKYWSVIQLPQAYAATNWPIRYSAIDTHGLYIAVAGRTGIAHYSILTKKWKLFGNESQEKDFVVSGGLLWWNEFVVIGCYSLLDRTDEIRCYPEECKLDNQFGNRIQVRAPIISLNMFRDQLIVLTADGIISLFVLSRCNGFSLNVECAYELDVKSICIHPACIVSLTITNLRSDFTTKSVSTASSHETPETIIVNVCGRILMIHRDSGNNVINSLMASCLASCVECFWLSNTLEKSPMRDCLWLYSGIHGMRVWLPILPPSDEKMNDGPHRLHTFMSKRIMLSFSLKLYPLVILFDNVIVLGVDNETTLYTYEKHSHFALPFSFLERKSQIYLHKILRQLIKRNLGYSAWEIAKSYRPLPYFPHSLELLLHEVLEEEATSKEPISDALLPSILDFIREFPIYLQTIVQCARKIEIALWPYLFSIAGKPKELFQLCLQSEQLETAASYLIILQNLEPSVISKQYATLLLDIALQHRKWDLAKDLIRFLNAIDPNEIESPRSSLVVNIKIAPISQTQSQVNQNPEVFNLIFGSIARERSFSTTVASNLPKEKKEKLAITGLTPKTSVASAVTTNENIPVATNNSGIQSFIRRKSERQLTKEQDETFCIEIILQRHARSLLQKCKLIDLGYMSAFLDFHLVSWLSQETEHAAKLDDFVQTLTCLHEELQLPPPFSELFTKEANSIFPSSNYYQIQRQFLLDSRQNQHNTSNRTSESGYVSLALMDTPTSTNNENTWQGQIPSIKEHEVMQYNTLPNQTTENQKTRVNPQIVNNIRYEQICSLHHDIPVLSLGLECVSNNEINEEVLPERWSIKIRYLLQLFIEANCIDYALVLSILLQDAASIGRIINVVIRSASLSACHRILNALKHLSQMSFQRECLYHSFMISLQPYIYLLDNYILSISNSEINANTDRSLQVSDICDTIQDQSNTFMNLSHSGNINANVSWEGDKFAHDVQHISRQTSDNKGSSGIQNKSGQSRSSKEVSHRTEQISCRVM